MSRGAGVLMLMVWSRATRPREAGKTSANFQGQVDRFSRRWILIFTTACGYHTAGHSISLPTNVQTIAIPAFVNRTQTYKIEQRLTSAVVREMVTRTHYHILNEASDSADATLRGVVISTSTSPLTYDSQTGRASSALVVVTAKSNAHRPPGQSAVRKSRISVSRGVPGLARAFQFL